MSDGKLQRRWRELGAANLVARVVTALDRHDPLGDLSLPVVEGRVDLRGFRLPQTRAAWSFGDVELADVDLSASQLDGVTLTASRLDNCLFDRASLRNASFIGTSFRDASFEDADLRESLLGAPYRGVVGEISRTSFRRADLRRLLGPTVDFVDCDFTGAVVQHVDFNSATFRRCTFSGRLYDVLFWKRGSNPHQAQANTMEGVDFRAADLDAVGFRGLDLSHALLPANASHLVIPRIRCVMDRMRVLLASSSDPDDVVLLRWLVEERRWEPEDPGVGLVTVADLQHLVSDVPRTVAAIKEARSQCAGEKADARSNPSSAAV